MVSAIARSRRRANAGWPRFDGDQRYAEGTAVRFPVKGPKDLTTVKKLAEIKLEH